MSERAVAKKPGLTFLPPEVRDLPFREREIPVTIYNEGAMTAKLLQDRLACDLSNSALRSMLGRLCRKGILKREKLNGSRQTSNHRIPYVYFPVITMDAMRRSVLRQIARDYFDGSLLFVVWTTIEVLNDEIPPQALKNWTSRLGDLPRLHIAA